MPEFHAVESFDDLQRPDVVAKRFPHIFTPNGLLNDCRQYKHNGMAECGAVLMIKNKYMCHVPGLLKWVQRQQR